MKPSLKPLRVETALALDDTLASVSEQLRSQQALRANVAIVLGELLKESRESLGDAWGLLEAYRRGLIRVGANAAFDERVVAKVIHVREAAKAANAARVDLARPTGCQCGGHWVCDACEARAARVA